MDTLLSLKNSPLADVAYGEYVKRGKREKREISGEGGGDITTFLEREEERGERDRTRGEEGKEKQRFGRREGGNKRDSTHFLSCAQVEASEPHTRACAQVPALRFGRRGAPFSPGTAHYHHDHT